MERLLNITVGDMLEQTAAKFPDVQAVKYIERDFDMTYSQFNAEVDAVAKGLMGLGFCKGEHIAIWATNYPEWLLLLFASAKIGCVLVTVNTNYKAFELEYLLKQSDSKALFICDGLKDVDCERIILELAPEIHDSCPGALYSQKFPFLKLVVTLDNRYKGMLHWSQIKEFGLSVTDEEYLERKNSLNPDEIVNMQYTSGTTGFPKGVMLTHNNIVNNGKSIGDCMAFTENDRLCIPVPFFHCFGLVLAVMAATTHGTTMLPLLFYTPMKVMHTIQFEKCTAVHGVPTMFIAMLEHRDFAKYNYSTLRTGIMAGSTCPKTVMKDVVEKMNMKEITIVFGLTEASPGCTQTTTKDSVEKRVSTVGRPLPHVECKIIDPETGATLGANQAGEFCARGYNIMKGYYKMPEATALAIDKDGWLHTGDKAEVDDDGYYKITGRLKDMIIRGGENISPLEIEDFLLTHKAIKDVQIVSIESEIYGEEVVAYVIPKDDMEIDEDDVKEYVYQHMARHKVPSFVRFIDKFPMTASGKIQKYVLRDMAKNDAEIQKSLKSKMLSRKGYKQ